MNKLISLILLLFTISNYGNSDSLSIDKKVMIDHEEIVARKFQPNFKTNYKDTSFVYEFKTPEKNAWDRFKEWLYDLFKDFFNLADKSKSLNHIDTILRVLAALLIIFVIYMIVKAILNKEGSWIFGRNTQAKIIDYTDVEKNIHLVDFKKLVASAIAKDDKRLATRYYYLWLLKKLSDATLIEWHPEKTNTEYSYEIKNQETKENFNYLSYLYNYIWYGEFEITEAIFNKTKEDFEKAITSIK
ncbi:MAG: DUF4129 domain-containing protein [Bacteroidota bacterium]